MNKIGKTKLPKGWEIRALGDIAKIITGKTPPTQRQELFGNKYPFITPTNIDNSLRFCDPDRFLSEEGANFQKSHLLPKNAICYTCIASIGKICMTKQDSFTNQQINSLIVNTNISHWFLFYALKYITPHIKNIAGRTAADIVNKTQFSNTKVLLPPLHEQKAIADTLSTWEEAIEKTEYLITAKEKRFRWLLRTLISDQCKSGWKKANLVNLCQIKTGKKDVNTGNPDGKYPFFTCAKDHTYSDTYSFDMEAILLAGNGYIGNPILYKGKFEAYQRTYILHEFKGVDSEYLRYLLKRNLQKKIAQEKQEAIMPYIKLKTLQTIEVILPPVSEQKSITSLLHSVEKEIELLEKLANLYRLQKRGLIQKLLTGKWRIPS